MSEKDQDYIVKIERAITEKYGEEAIQNPRGNWCKEKENKYLKEMKAFYKKLSNARKESEKEEYKGFLISKALLNKDTKRACPTCKKYSFERKDDLYMNKFECCFDCYIQYVEHREERWQSGWRPDNTRAIIK